MYYSVSPIQPAWVPPNVRFMVDDFESPWLQPENHWDYVHGRNTACITKDIPKMLSEAYRYASELPIPVLLVLNIYAGP